MLVGGFGFLLDSLTSYYLFSVLSTIFALAGTYFVCFHHKHFESNLPANVPEAGSPLNQPPIHKDDISQNLESPSTSNEINEASKTAKQNVEAGAEIKKPARIAEMVIKAGMSDEQMLQEKRAQKEQLTEIFKLMQQQADKFGSVTIDDVEEQMKLYR